MVNAFKARWAIGKDSLQRREQASTRQSQLRRILLAHGYVVKTDDLLIHGSHDIARFTDKALKKNQEKETMAHPHIMYTVAG